MIRFLAALGAVFLLSLIAGCGSDQLDTAPVTGTVSYNGQPVEGASVTFQPKDATGRAATGVTDGDGKFTLRTYEEGDGAILGEHSVTIVAISAPTSADEDGQVPEELINEPFVDDYEINSTPIPQKYADATTSGLTFTVEDVDLNEPKFELTD